MKFESALTFVTHHSEVIIQWVFFLILVLAGSLVARGLFWKRDESETATAGEAPGLNGVQTSLDKILAQTAKLESLTVQTGGGTDEARVNTLKSDLASREEEIKKLKSEAASQTGQNSDKLAERIKELEGRLAEYEILEDDIADLSLYKDENTRLKSELDKLRSASPSAMAATTGTGAPTAAPEPSATPAGDGHLPVQGGTASEAIVAEFAHAVSMEAPSPESPDVAGMTIPDTGNPMADFESTVQLERKLSSPPGSANRVGSAPTAPNPAAPVAPPVPAAPESDDLFAEFSKSPEPLTLSKAEEDSSTLDTDRMMAEMASLVNLEPSEGSSLDEAIDIDKMAVEASAKR